MLTDEHKKLVGRKVRRLTNDGNYDECGVIVHVWWNDTAKVVDCYITFFGNKQGFPNGQPEQIPYTLRYAVDSLEFID